MNLKCRLEDYRVNPQNSQLFSLTQPSRRIDSVPNDQAWRWRSVNQSQFCSVHPDW
jgi:hypothetical protein